MKKIITINIYLDETTNKFNGEMRHRCESLNDALDVVQEFVNRKRKKGGKGDA